MSSVKNRVEAILGEALITESSIGGGCIANARIIKTASGREFFLKSYSSSGSSILRNEANGLKELSKADALRVPAIIHLDDDFLLMEKISRGRKGKDFFIEFGKGFARMHMHTADKFGFYEDNYIGSTPQKNLPFSDDWTTFYLNNRLLYQLHLAEANGYADSRLKSSFRKLESRIDSILKGSGEPPALLHGDLWGGNYMVDETGRAVLIDPAVYYGHREADLAMTLLFGGFSPEFYESYEDTYPLKDGWRYRSNIYKLYHLMNHLNIFGSGYYHQTLDAMEEYI